MAAKFTKVSKVVLCLLALVPFFSHALEFTLPKDVTEEELANASDEEAQYGSSSDEAEVSEPENDDDEGEFLDTDESDDVEEFAEVDDEDDDEPDEIEDTETAEIDDDDPGFMEFPLEEPEAETAEVAETETQEVSTEGQGQITGQVFDKDTGAPIRGVAIAVEGTDMGTITDEKGNFKLSAVPEGNYTLAYFKTGYLAANITDVSVVPGEVKTLDFALPPRPTELSDDVYDLGTITVTAEQANEMVMKLELKMESDRAIDIFSSEDFSKFAASDVADAVKRIAGVSVNEGKFPSVRGLNDRYTVTTLNGMPLPSPDPFRKSPQFDIFPSSLLDSIIVSKTAAADLDGESTAANFDLLTKRLPDEFFIKFSAGTGFHSGSIEDFRSFDRGGDSYLWTDGAKNFNQSPRPNNPTDDIAESDFRRSDQLGSESKNAYPNTSFSLSIGNTFQPWEDRRLGIVFAGYHKRETLFIEGIENQDYDFRGADTFIPVVFDNFDPPIVAPQSVSVPFGTETQYDYEEYQENVRLGALLGVSFEVADDITLFGNIFSSRTADTLVIIDNNGQNPDESITQANDLFPNNDAFLVRERLYYVERSLNLGQVGAELDFSEVHLEPKLYLNLQKARTTQDEPDFRDTVVVYRFSDYPDGNIPESVDTDNTNYNISSDDNVSVSSNSWRFVQEDEDSGRIDTEIKPLKDLTLKIGGLTRRSDRKSTIETYFENRADNDDTNQIPAGTGVSSGNFEAVSNAIRGTSEASREIDVFYYSGNYEPFQWAKLNLGFRFESSIIEVDSETLLPSNNSLVNVFRGYDEVRNEIRESPGTPSRANLVRAEEAEVLGTPEGFRNEDGDSILTRLFDDVLLPSVNLTLTPIEAIQFKLAYFETINRPSFREITGDIFVDTENGDLLAGNPFLESSETESFDFRAEIYLGRFIGDSSFAENIFGADDMIGISLFYKEIENPIEFIRPTDQNIDEMPFNNPEGATAEGIEIEFYKTLGFLGLSFFDYFSVGGNMSFTDAEAGVSAAEAALLGLNNNIDPDQLDDTRVLAEQPDEIINLNLIFDHPDWGTVITLAYNEKSEILESIGSESSLDAYRGPVERLDLIISQRLTNGLKVKFAVKNLLDEGFETYFRNRAPDFGNNSIQNLRDPSSFADDKIRKSIDSVGMTYSFSAELEF